MPSPLSPGQIIGRHRLIRLISVGGMGGVYEGLHVALDRRDALKILLPQFAAIPELRQRFINEAKFTNRISHPGVVQIYEINELPDGTPYFVMEYLDGETLSQRITNLSNRQNDLIGMMGIGPLRQIAKVIANCHEKGLIHRDLKPNNIMIVRDPDMIGGERAKLLDFGIVKLSESINNIRYREETIKTQAGYYLGTPAYMAPERWNIGQQITELVDVYSMGVILFQILSGKLPYTAENDEAFAFEHSCSSIPMHYIPNLVPSNMRILVEQMLAKNASNRPSMLRVIQVLDQHLDIVSSRPFTIPESYGSAAHHVAGPDTPTAKERAPSSPEVHPEPAPWQLSDSVAIVRPVSPTEKTTHGSDLLHAEVPRITAVDHSGPVAKQSEFNHSIVGQSAHQPPVPPVLDPSIPKKKGIWKRLILAQAIAGALALITRLILSGSSQATTDSTAIYMPMVSTAPIMDLSVIIQSPDLDHQDLKVDSQSDIFDLNSEDSGPDISNGNTKDTEKQNNCKFQDITRDCIDGKWLEKNDPVFLLQAFNDSKLQVCPNTEFSIERGVIDSYDIQIKPSSVNTKLRNTADFKTAIKGLNRTNIPHGAIIKCK